MEKQNQNRLIEILNYMWENTDKNHYVKPFLFDAYETAVINYIKFIPVSNIPKEAIISFI